MSRIICRNKSKVQVIHGIVEKGITHKASMNKVCNNNVNNKSSIFIARRCGFNGVLFNMVIMVITHTTLHKGLGDICF